MARGFLRASTERLYHEGTPPVIQEPFTAALWFNHTENYEDTVWGFGSFTNFNHFFNIGIYDSGSGNYLYQRTNDGAGQAQATTSNARTGYTWEHACAILAADDDRTIILNGDWSNRGTNSTSKSVSTNLNRTALGCYPNGGSYYQYFGGYLAEFAIWNEALEQYEVEALSKGICPIFIRPDALVAYAPLIRNDNDLFWGITFSINGTPTVEPHSPIIRRPSGIWVPTISGVQSLYPSGIITSEAFGSSLWMASPAYPDSDVNIGNWKTYDDQSTNLYTMIDEIDWNDTDYIKTPVSVVPSASEFSLSNIGDPGVDTNHVVEYRYRKENAVQTVDLTVRLMEGTTEIASWIHYDISTTWTYAKQTLTTLQASNISDYDNLRLKFEAVEGT